MTTAIYILCAFISCVVFVASVASVVPERLTGFVIAIFILLLGWSISWHGVKEGD